MIEELGDGMYEKMKQHDETLSDHDVRIDTLEEITLALREADRLHVEKMKQLETNSIKLENVILTSSQETQSAMKESNAQMKESNANLLGLVKDSLGYKSTTTQQMHELKMAKLHAWSTFVLKVGGGLGALAVPGGVIYYIINHYIN